MIKITENDIRLMTEAAVSRILKEYNSWTGEEDQYTLDLVNAASTCAYNYYMKNQQAGMQFMKKFYPEGAEILVADDYKDMIHEACGEAKVFWDMPDEEAVVGDYSNDITPEIGKDVNYLLQAGIEPEIVNDFKEYSLDWADDPENNKFPYEY